MGISRQASPIHIMVHQTQPENMEYLNYVGNIITNDARCTREVKSRIAMSKAFQQEEDSLHQHFGLKFKEEAIKSAAFGVLLCVVLKTGHFGK